MYVRGYQIVFTQYHRQLQHYVAREGFLSVAFRKKLRLICYKHIKSMQMNADKKIWKAYLHEKLPFVPEIWYRFYFILKTFFKARAQIKPLLEFLNKHSKWLNIAEIFLAILLPKYKIKIPKKIKCGNRTVNKV